MSKSDKFFQFPVSALRMRQCPTAVDEIEAKQRLREILGFCIVEVGRGYIEGHDEGEVDDVVERSPWKPSGSTTKYQDAVLCGMAVLNVGFNDPSTTILPNAYKAEHKVIDGLSSGSKILRLRTDLYWDYCDGKNDWTWREFSILCAVYAGIGAKPLARLSYEYIGALAAGYSRIADLPHNLVTPMHKVRHTVRKLESRGLLFSLCANGRHTSYSHSLDHQELADAIVFKETERQQSPKSKALESLRQRLSKMKEPS
jgi:hypothetical protein